jgi:hypothetical protein
MSNTIQDRLFEIFVALSGGQTKHIDALVDSADKTAAPAPGMARMTSPVEAAAQPGAPAEIAATFVAIQQQSAAQALPAAVSPVSSVLQEVVKQTTQSNSPSAKESSSGGSGVLHTVESIASTVFKNALGVMPIVSGLISLFGGGGDNEAPPPLVKYALPSKIDFRAAESESGFGSVDYDQSGRPRAYNNVPAPAASSVAPAPQITVNVQAMDARSFLDRSGDIAAAVRDAMLNLNSINDVVNEL